MANTSPAVQFPAFQPAMRLITVITQANPAVVTTSFAHQYVNGIIVRLDIPQVDGMQQISGPTYPLTVTSPTTFSLPVDSTNFQAFTNNQYAMVIPVGEVTSQLNAATRNVLPYPAT
jgi:hypothetical protein